VATGSRIRTLSDAVPALRRGGDGLIVAVLGSLDLDDATMLARLGHSATAVAFVLDATTWGVHDRRNDGIATATSRAATLLERSNWRVVRVRAGDTISTAWPLAARGAVQPAGGAA
jgi:hypothetical protein